MAVLVIHLDKEETEKRKEDLRGLELAIRLYKEYEAEQPVVITSPKGEAVRFQGSAFFSLVFKSPLTGGMMIASSALAPGYSIYRLGYEAIVIVGRARKLQSISINAEGAEFNHAEMLRGKSSIETESAVKKNITDIVMAIGRAGENGVLYASLQCAGRELASKGLGCLLGWKNLKAITLPGFSRKDSVCNGKLERKVIKAHERSRISKTLRKEGGGRFVDSALQLGWLPVRNYSDRFDPRAYALDGRSILDKYGMYPDSCQDCYFSCTRRTKENEILPSWEECTMLGSNLGFFSLESVRILSDAVREEGLGIADTGALLSYLATLPGTDYTLPVLNGRGIDEYVRIIHLIGENRGLGEKLAHGLKSFPDAIETALHLPILTDLRGDKAGAILCLLNIPASLPVSWLLPKKPLSDRAAAVMALYETAYRFALIDEGYSPMGMIPQWWGRFPSFIYNFPFILRIVAMLFTSFGLKGRDIFRHGLSLAESFATAGGSVPDIFMLEPVTAYGDNATVSPVKLMEYYQKEKRIALRVLKSRSEKRKRPSSDNAAAVGPDEERGLDGDPGLQNTTPSSS